MVSPVKIIRDTGYLYPVFRTLLEQGLRICRNYHIWIYPFETYRFPQRQEMLYNQGRIAPGKIVTKSPPGYSWHEYGLAADLVFDGMAEPGIQWDWRGDYIEEKKDDYARMGQIMLDVGLEWLGPVGDSPHVQFSKKMAVQTANSIKQKYGVFGVWEEFNNILKGEKRNV